MAYDSDGELKNGRSVINIYDLIAIAFVLLACGGTLIYLGGASPARLSRSLESLLNTEDEIRWPLAVCAGMIACFSNDGAMRFVAIVSVLFYIWPYRRLCSWAVAPYSWKLASRIAVLFFVFGIFYGLKS